MICENLDWYYCSSFSEKKQYSAKVSALKMFRNLRKCILIPLTIALHDFKAAMGIHHEEKCQHVIIFLTDPFCLLTWSGFKRLTVAICRIKHHIVTTPSFKLCCLTSFFGGVSTARLKGPFTQCDSICLRQQFYTCVFVKLFTWCDGFGCNLQCTYIGITHSNHTE